MTPMVTLVRHGDTAMNKGQTHVERFRSILDIRLNDNGQQTARDIAEKLIGTDVAAIHTSDLRRAVETAQIIADIIGAPCFPDFRFRPWNLGHLTGTPVKDGISIINRYAEHPGDVLPGGECFAEFSKKFFTGLDELFRLALETQTHRVLVAHSRNFQLTKASYATPGQFTNHHINLSVFNDYSNETPPGESLAIKYLNGSWQLVRPSNVAQIVKEVYRNAISNKG